MKEEKEERMRNLAKNLGVKYIEEKRDVFQIFEDNLVTTMYNLEKIMGYPIKGDFPLAKFHILIEEVKKDKNLRTD